MVLLVPGFKLLSKPQLGGLMFEFCRCEIIDAQFPDLGKLPWGTWVSTVIIARVWYPDVHQLGYHLGTRQSLLGGLEHGFYFPQYLG